ncbi:MAG: class II aldolase/adducin family protein [Clostridiales bacterium]|nr:class II aldolase/adducin family protein [Clostridiales bacterium]
MYENEKLEIIAVAQEIKRIGLVQLTGGNVSVRMKNGDIVVTPSGMPYETMTPDQVLVLNKEGEVIEGTLRPSVDAIALKYIYDHCPDVSAIIHTHQPYATAAGLVGDEMPACCTTLCNVCLGSVPVAPYSAAASEDMGIQTVEYIGDKRAVILKHHGVIAVGPTLHDAECSVVYLEDAAKCYLAAKAASPTGEIALMTPSQVEEAVNTHKTYGQN